MQSGMASVVFEAVYTENQELSDYIGTGEGRPSSSNTPEVTLLHQCKCVSIKSKTEYVCKISLRLLWKSNT